MYLDFEEIKKSTPFEKAMNLLGLEMKKAGSQFRGPCPKCKSGGERALVVTPQKGWYCFALQAGGDVIALTAHIKDCSAKDAAQFLAGGNCTSTTTSTRNSKLVPESVSGDETKKFAPLAYLEPAHMAVDALGFCTDFSAKHGIGYAPRGTMKGYVLIPFRDDLGNLLGYVGVQECKLPASFTPNVVEFKKQA